MATPSYFDEGQQYSDDDILAVIAQRESGGNDNAWDLVNDYGMRGPWQFSPATYEEVAKNNGLDGSDWSPENQLAVARAHIHDLRSRLGTIGAVQAWLGGEGNVGNDSFTDSYGTSIGSYTQDVLNNLQNFTGQNPGSIYGKNSGPYQTNILEGYKRAGGQLNNPNEPLPMDFINRMMSEPTVNASQRVEMEFLRNQGPQLAATAMGAWERNKDWFNQFNKMTADSAREGAAIENKNRQKTMAAQFADQIAKSNNTANIAILAKLGAALTGVQFDPNNKNLADAGQLFLKQVDVNNNATKANIAQANKERELALEELKTKAYLDKMSGAGSYSKGGAGGGTAGASGGGGSPLGYVVEDEDSIKNNVDKLINSPQFKQYQNIIWDPQSTPAARDLATKGALKLIADYGVSMEQVGKKDTANELFDNIAGSIITQAQEMSHPAGTNPADQAAQNNINQGLLNDFMQTVVTHSADGTPITLADMQNSMNATENMVSSGQLINRW